LFDSKCKDYFVNTSLANRFSIEKLNIDGESEDWYYLFCREVSLHIAEEHGLDYAEESGPTRFDFADRVNHFLAMNDRSDLI